MTRDKFTELVNLYLDREIKPGQLSRLKKEIEHSHERRAIFEEHCRLHAATQRACRRQSQTETETEHGQDDLTPDFESVYQPVFRPNKRGQYASHGLTYTLGALAACLVLTLTVTVTWYASFNEKFETLNSASSGDNLTNRYQPAAASTPRHWAMATLAEEELTANERRQDALPIPPDAATLVDWVAIHDGQSATERLELLWQSHQRARTPVEIYPFFGNPASPEAELSAGTAASRLTGFQSQGTN